MFLVISLVVIVEMYIKCCLSCSNERCDFVVTSLQPVRIGKCDNKANTSFVVTFLFPTGEEKCDDKLKFYVGVADAFGTLPLEIFPPLGAEKAEFTCILSFPSWIKKSQNMLLSFLSCEISKY